MALKPNGKYNLLYVISFISFNRQTSLSNNVKLNRFNALTIKNII